MSFRRYVASGRGGPLAIPRVLGVALVAGIAVGAAEGVLGRWISLLLLFPALIGAAAGGLAGLMVRKTHLRAPTIAMALGVCGGAAGYATVHVVDYLRFRSDVAEAIAAKQPGAPEVAVDHLLAAENGHTGFVGYLVFAAHQGVTIKRVGVGDPGLRLPGAGAWAVWALELVFAAGCAGFLARARAREPFCEACDAWYAEPRQLAAGGDASHRKRVITAIDQGNLEAAAAAFAGPRGRQFNLAFASSTCPRCNTDVYVALKKVSARRAAHAPTLAQWIASKDDVAQLAAIVTQR